MEYGIQGIARKVNRDWSLDFFGLDSELSTGMVKLDETLLRKRSEHHDGLLCELEEVSLHQEQIEKIESVNMLCRHVKILLLQNNIISRIEGLNKLKELEYLNLALNNITRIENLSGCESLKKLDLSVNFIDFDELESVSSLQSNYNLEDLYLVGNPISLNWDASKYRSFIIGTLPSLKQLDGELITESERIGAKAHLKALQGESVSLAVRVRKSKCDGSYDDPASARISRSDRVDMYRELGDQRAEQQRAENKRLGIDSTSKPARSVPSVLNTRGEIRQCNEGGYEYSLTERSDHIVFEIFPPKFMDTSLIDIDLNPTYVRCVISGKLTQIKFDSEIVVGTSKIQRSKTTGGIRCVCPLEGVVSLSSSPSAYEKVVPSPIMINTDLPPALERIESS